MTLHQLKVWSAVAKHQSISRAADELHIRQPSVSIQVKRLEKECGIKLYKVIIGHPGVEVTQAGRVVLKYAKKILSHVDNLEKELRSSIKRRRRHR